MPIADQSSALAMVNQRPGLDDSPYPGTFQQIAELIATGARIPGIREIPNELNQEEPSEPKIAKLEGAGRKPWERGQDKSIGLDALLHDHEVGSRTESVP